MHQAQEAEELSGEMPRVSTRSLDGESLSQGWDAQDRGGEDVLGKASLPSAANPL